MLTAHDQDPAAPSAAAPLRIALMSCAHTHAAAYAAQLAPRGDVELVVADPDGFGDLHRSEEHTSELQSPDNISYAVFCLNFFCSPWI